jgi:hypothetical protein
VSGLAHVLAEGAGERPISPKWPMELKMVRILRKGFKNLKVALVDDRISVNKRMAKVCNLAF